MEQLFNFDPDGDFKSLSLPEKFFNAPLKPQSFKLGRIYEYMKLFIS